ncbi:hypothetical protein DENSPDRAFT_483985 [Dentipellis sp. KUC8613]|nr:hypothetical protein DENSPDRAFT_483985 [Dentipellis sp. KUC8613]
MPLRCRFRCARPSPGRIHGSPCRFSDEIRRDCRWMSVDGSGWHLPLFLTFCALPYFSVLTASPSSQTHNGFRAQQRYASAASRSVIYR